MKKVLLVVFAVLAISITGCEDHRTVVHQDSGYVNDEYSSTQHVIHHDSGSNMNAALTGLAVGAMLSNGGNGGSHTTINKTVVNKTYTTAHRGATTAPGTTSVQTAVKPTKAGYRDYKVNKNTYKSQQNLNAKYRTQNAQSYKQSAKTVKYRSKSVNTYKPKKRVLKYRSKKRK